MDKVAIIGIRGLPAKYGAFDQFVNQFIKFCNSNKKNIYFYISADKKILLKIFKYQMSLNFILLEEMEFLFYFITWYLLYFFI